MENPKINIRKSETLSDNHYLLQKVTFDYTIGKKSETQSREVYDRGNGACVLLYNREYKNVVLIRQFRLPTYLNKNTTGMMVEVCAGLIEDDDPAETVRREAIEETGYHISKVEKVFASYMSPGAVTEILHFFIAEYTKDMKQSQGGGLSAEQEHIQVMEIPFAEALDMVKTGAISDAKTIMLLQYAQINKLF